jgi:tellurite methyltransferase
MLHQFGNIDIYLFDQLLKGRFQACKNILDLGCGNGRNLTWFLKEGYNVFGLDSNAEAIENLRLAAANYNSSLASTNFIVAEINTNIPLPHNYFDLIICNAVLHFAENKAHFEEMLFSAWRLLAPGGYFFARLASDIGIEDKVTAIGNGRYLLPDGSERYLVNAAILKKYEQKLEAKPYEPLKTSVVQDLRSMTTWCIQK